MLYANESWLKWNEQEFEIVLVGPAFLNRSTLSTLNFFS